MLEMLRDDIIGLIDKNGATVASYTYDSWGKLIFTTGTLASTVGVKNPYRYRGYRYDTETGLYYLNSIYYSPEWGRFINADGIIGQTGELLGHNMFAYCKNNPVNGRDPSGYKVAFEDEETQRQYEEWLTTRTPITKSSSSNQTIAEQGLNLAFDMVLNSRANAKEFGKTNVGRGIGVAYTGLFFIEAPGIASYIVAIGQGLADGVIADNGKTPSSDYEAQALYIGATSQQAQMQAKYFGMMYMWDQVGKGIRSSWDKLAETGKSGAKSIGDFFEKRGIYIGW